MLSSDGRELNPNSEGTNANSHQKSVLVWKGTELQEKFLKAQHDLGKEATSNQILEHMEKNGVTGLTRKQVSSHLQKHRLKCPATSSSKDTLHSSSNSGNSSFGSKAICGARGNETSSDDREVNSNSEGTSANSYTKPVLDWTDELQKKFLNAVHYHGGYEKANRSQILKHMMENGVTGLDVSQVASHLQKHRSKEKNKAAGKGSAASSSKRTMDKSNLHSSSTSGHSSFVSKSAQEDCPPVNNARKKQMITQSGQSLSTPHFSSKDISSSQIAQTNLHKPISTNTKPLNQPNCTNFGMGSTDSGTGKVVLSNTNYDNINNYAGNQQQGGEGDPSNKTSVEANHPTSQLDDAELFTEEGFKKLMDLNFHEILAILDENTANSSNDKPNQLQAGEAEVILQINQPLNDHHDFPSSPFNQRIIEEVEKLMKDDSANPSNDCHPILNRTPNQGWDDDDMDSFFEDLPF